MKNLFKKNGKKCGLFRKAMIASSVVGTMANVTALTALADGGGSEWESVTVSGTGDVNASTLMGNIIGILLTITRYIGIALVVYGVYEVVMSFMQNQPEAKTKGIIMALAGVVMIALKSVLSTLKLIQ